MSQVHKRTYYRGYNTEDSKGRVSAKKRDNIRIIGNQDQQ